MTTQGYCFGGGIRRRKIIHEANLRSWDGGEEKPSHRAHRFIDQELIGDWTLNIKPEKIIEIPRTGDEFSKGPRVIYFWKFK